MQPSSTLPQPAAPLHSPDKYVQVCKQQIALINQPYMCPLFVYNHLQGISILNTFAASYLNTQGLNNSCLKSPASTLVDLNFNRAHSALSA